MSISVPESDRAGVRERGTPWIIWKTVYLNRLFDDWHSGQKNATVSNIRPETVRHGESK